MWLCHFECLHVERIEQVALFEAWTSDIHLVILDQELLLEFPVGELVGTFASFIDKEVRESLADSHSFHRVRNLLVGKAGLRIAIVLEVVLLRMPLNSIDREVLALPGGDELDTVVVKVRANETEILAHVSAEV